jgi:putative transposase
MVRPAAKRAAAAHLQESMGMSERQACDVVGLNRSTKRYVSTKKEPPKLRKRLRELAAQRRRFGYRRLTVMLRREGYKVNHKRVYRMYREENLAVRRKPRRKRGAAIARVLLEAVERANQRWAMDFVSDQLSSGKRFRTLTVMDHFTREGLATDVGFSMPSRRVIEALDRLVGERGAPAMIVVDNGPEFISKALDEWAYRKGIKLHFIRPGKPTENAHCESFNGRFRDEFLNENWFNDLPEVALKADEWRVDYNEVRPHSALGYLTPAEYAVKHSAHDRARFT